MAKRAWIESLAYSMLSSGCSKTWHRVYLRVIKKEVRHSAEARRWFQDAVNELEGEVVA